jgi:hypothetical protein
MRILSVARFHQLFCSMQTTGSTKSLGPTKLPWSNRTLVIEFSELPKQNPNTFRAQDNVVIHPPDHANAARFERRYH